MPSIEERAIAFSNALTPLVVEFFQGTSEDETTEAFDAYLKVVLWQVFHTVLQDETEAERRELAGVLVNLTRDAALRCYATAVRGK